MPTHARSAWALRDGEPELGDFEAGVAKVLEVGLTSRFGDGHGEIDGEALVAVTYAELEK